MKMKEIFPNPSNGIFNYINIENAGLDNKVYLNIAYHTNNGNKLISPLLENFVTNNSITSDNLTSFSNKVSVSSSTIVLVLSFQRTIVAGSLNITRSISGRWAVFSSLIIR